MNYGKIGKMKYIEELSIGDIFTTKNILYILTSDFKKDGSRMGISLSNGFSFWFNGQDPVDIQPIFTMDKENNIIPITNANHNPQNTNIYKIPSVAHTVRTS